MKSPMDQFSVYNILELKVFGLDISITNSAVYMLIVSFLFISFGLVGVLKKNTAYYILKKTFDFVENIAANNLKKDYKQYLPFLTSLFVFVLLGNIIGIIPYSFTFTSQIVITLSLAIICFLISVVIGLKKNGIGFFRIFFPAGTPLYLAPIMIPVEVISFVSKPISLGLRLFVNMIAGHIMIKVFAMLSLKFSPAVGIIPFILIICLIIFESLVAFLQAYIFVVLTAMYIESSRNLH